MKKVLSRILIVFLVILATLGMLAYVMQEAFHDDITFVEFFQMIKDK